MKLLLIQIANRMVSAELRGTEGMTVGWRHTANGVDIKVNKYETLEYPLL